MKRGYFLAKIMSLPCLLVPICASGNKPMLAAACTGQQCGKACESQPGHCAGGSHNLGRQTGPPRSRRTHSMEAHLQAPHLTYSVTLGKVADLLELRVPHL